ncbi:hypothetical protein DESC_740210 [Desulfosarcina cetonica]|nr:hypothetical protein DESC_740210 [Desulfosarcina cetonica]
MSESSVGSNPTPSAKQSFIHDRWSNFGEMAESAEGARLLSECVVKAAPRVRIPLSPPFVKNSPAHGGGLFLFGSPALIKI